MAQRGMGRAFLLAALQGALAAAQSTYFEPLAYRSPAQCERSQCLSSRRTECREHLPGFYLREKGCPAGEICTDCTQGNGSKPTVCMCEKSPATTPVGYGESCGPDTVCTEGTCYRPCHTYPHSTACPAHHCAWEPFSRSCAPKAPAEPRVYWKDSPATSTPAEQGARLVSLQASYPIGWEDFRASSAGYRIEGLLLSDVAGLERLFLRFDRDNDGGLNASEYARLPQVLSELGAVATAAPQTGGRLLQEAFGRPPIICNAQRPIKYYCSFDHSCKADCKECGWKSATDHAFSVCVQPTPITCANDGNQVFCPSDGFCHPAGDCSACVDRPILDHSQHKCVAVWWAPEPFTDTTHWVCRPRSKVGMPCTHDQDCVHGLRRCLNGACQPFQPYNLEQTCAGDLDCPHLGYYCPTDPTGDQNPYWVQYCRQQRGEGMTCAEDRECSPELRCNTQEAFPRCRRLFSLALGAPAVSDDLCEFGWRDRDSRCSLAAMSKEVGRDCDDDEDCATTDLSGRTGRCTCKAWWDRGDAKYCAPVAGDYARHQERLRDLLFFRATKCGSFWTEEECLRVFGSEALRLKLEVDCETQRLSRGPFLPPADCGIQDEERFPDHCARLQQLGR